MTIDRRAFLVRTAGVLGAAGALALVGCGDDGDSAQTDRSTTTGSVGSVGSVVLGQLFNPAPTYARAGAAQRLTFGLFDAMQAPLDSAPAELEFQLLRVVDGSRAEPVGSPVTAALHDEGLDRGYYPVRFTPDEEGVWMARTTVEGEPLEASFQVGPRGGPGVLEVGATMPGIESATDAETLGVSPLCTRSPGCPFHDLTIAGALDLGRPLVVSVSTPAYCQVAICGPVLDLVVDAAPAYPDTTFVHLEPWQAPVPGDPFAGGAVAAMDELGLDFEPTLFLVAADGTVVDRLDNIYDAGELRSSLDALTA
jgi:hypothetical protein